MSSISCLRSFGTALRYSTPATCRGGGSSLTATIARPAPPLATTRHPLAAAPFRPSLLQQQRWMGGGPRNRTLHRRVIPQGQKQRLILKYCDELFGFDRAVVAARNAQPLPRMPHLTRRKRSKIKMRREERRKFIDRFVDGGKKAPFYNPRKPMWVRLESLMYHDIFRGWTKLKTFREAFEKSQGRYVVDTKANIMAAKIARQEERKKQGLRADEPRNKVLELYRKAQNASPKKVKLKKGGKPRYLPTDDEIYFVRLNPDIPERGRNAIMENRWRSKRKRYLANREKEKAERQAQKLKAEKERKKALRAGAKQKSASTATPVAKSKATLNGKKGREIVTGNKTRTSTNTSTQATNNKSEEARDQTQASQNVHVTKKQLSVQKLAKMEMMRERARDKLIKQQQQENAAPKGVPDKPPIIRSPAYAAKKRNVLRHRLNLLRDEGDWEEAKRKFRQTAQT